MNNKSLRPFFSSYVLAWDMAYENIIYTITTS